MLLEALSQISVDKILERLTYDATLFSAQRLSNRVHTSGKM